MKEKIMCCAIEFEIESIAYPERGAEHEVILCTNYDDRFAETKRFELCGLGYEVATSERLGFMTNTGRFVNSEEAFRIARDAGQIPSSEVATPMGVVRVLKPEDILKCN